MRKSSLIPAPLLLMLCSVPVVAENDGNNQRALEFPIVSAANDGTPLHGGLAVFPNGYVHNGYAYLFTHANFFNFWRPAGLTLCPTSDGNNETKGLWRVPMSNPYQMGTFIGRVAPCSDILGFGPNGNHRVGIGGTGAIGGNGKFYLTTNGTYCVSWSAGCMDTEFLGANLNPDNKSYAWQLTPILKISTLPNGQTLSWNSFIALKSFNYDPLPPSSYFPQISGARLWGYVQWGYVSGDFPAHLARVQIVENASTTRPNWQTTRVYIFASDGTWRQANAANGGTIDFVPYDALADFGWQSITSIYYDPSSGKYAGYTEQKDDPNVVPPYPGCDDHNAQWYTNPNLPEFYQHPIANERTEPELVTFGGTSVFYAWDGFTQNTWHVGGLVLHYGSKRYLFRGSTERICFNFPQNWSYPWRGSEITVEEIPANPLP